MGADVMMDLVEDAKVSVNGGQTSSQVTPLLHSLGMLFSFPEKLQTGSGTKTPDASWHKKLLPGKGSLLAG